MLKKHPFCGAFLVFWGFKFLSIEEKTLCLSAIACARLLAARHFHGYCISFPLYPDTASISISVTVYNSAAGYETFPHWLSIL
ncbi:hypothetical protein QDX08_24530 (plasmid) [Escherichia coli]|uniref:hypothetical protein n=1 Tax=Escherichia coli TaxID=562 RepID=UPI0024ACA3F2|nr:hypothetical protein [Escherichia coli]WHF85217.1 hypothetical protein QDX08_24530 [Escherichia coli]